MSGDRQKADVGKQRFPRKQQDKTQVSPKPAKEAVLVRGREAVDKADRFGPGDKDHYEKGV